MGRAKTKKVCNKHTNSGILVEDAQSNTAIATNTTVCSTVGYHPLRTTISQQSKLEGMPNAAKCSKMQLFYHDSRRVPNVAKKHDNRERSLHTAIMSRAR